MGDFFSCVFLCEVLAHATSRQRMRTRYFEGIAHVDEIWGNLLFLEQVSVFRRICDAKRAVDWEHVKPTSG